MKKYKCLESKSLSIILFVFLFLMYAVVYMTKNIFSSAMATIVEEGFMTKSQTGLINAFFWFAYALFQIIGGFAVDKYSPYKLIIIGLVGAVVSNIVIYFNQSYPVIIVAWTFNAIMQFGLWPGVFKIVSTQTAPSIRGTAVFWILLSGSVGLAMSLLVASFVSRWQQNFLVSIISLLIILISYVILNRFLDKRMVEKEIEPDLDRKNSNVEKKPILPLMMSSGLIVFMLVFLFRCATDNGIKMLTPVMLMESYDNLPAAIATRMSLVLVVFTVIGMFVSRIVQRKITRNEAKAQFILYFASVLPLIAVCFVGRIHYIFLLAALSLAVMSLSSATPFVQSFTVIRFEKYGRIGTVSGILNATGAAGNIVASYVFAKMSEMMSWEAVTISWMSVIAICTLLCIAVLPRWTKFIQK